MCFPEVDFQHDSRDDEITANSYGAPLHEQHSDWSKDTCHSAELAVLDAVEDLEERVYQASVYTKVTLSMYLCALASGRVNNGNRPLL